MVAQALVNRECAALHKLQLGGPASGVFPGQKPIHGLGEIHHLADLPMFQPLVVIARLAVEGVVRRLRRVRHHTSQVEDGGVDDHGHRARRHGARQRVAVALAPRARVQVEARQGRRLLRGLRGRRDHASGRERLAHAHLRLVRHLLLLLGWVAVQAAVHVGGRLRLLLQDLPDAPELVAQLLMQAPGQLLKLLGQALVRRRMHFRDALHVVQDVVLHGALLRREGFAGRACCSAPGSAAPE
mmetsp:Transcript_29231/g.74327  ORF Transcript_29231/g.74327 Transcript_29231/m.74327 type:complete len:242 (-) Transcript_29231:2-727(-)